MLRLTDLDVFRGVVCVFFRVCVCQFWKDGRKFKITSWMIVFFEGFEFDVILEWLNWWLFPTKSDDDDDNDAVRDRIALVHPCHYSWIVGSTFWPSLWWFKPIKASCFGTHWIGLFTSLWFPHGLDCWFKHIKTMSNPRGNSVDGVVHMPSIQGLDLPSRLPSLPGAEIGGIQGGKMSFV